MALLLKCDRPVQATSVPQRRNSSPNLIAKESSSNSVLCQVNETQRFNIKSIKNTSSNCIMGREAPAESRGRILYGV
jgi:hypothetical protein